MERGSCRVIGWVVARRRSVWVTRDWTWAKKAREGGIFGSS
jgi:hypothetical protein